MHNTNYDRSTNERFRYIKRIKGLNGNDYSYSNGIMNDVRGKINRMFY